MSDKTDDFLQHPAAYDVIVIGGGHAGVEAATAAARLGAHTLLLTQSIETIGQMSCNPAIGGIGKSHLVREIDALGGIMAEALDEAGIQYRTLNSRKGPAVRATRAQADRVLYRNAVRARVEATDNLDLFQQTVSDLRIDGDRVTGVMTQMGLEFKARSVVLTTGTFLDGRIHIGMKNYGGGRAGDAASTGLAKKLRAMPFRVDRLKTGTPPRIDGRSVDYSVMEEQPGDTPLPRLSFLEDAVQPQQVSCYITQTNEAMHDLIRDSLDRSPLYTGVIDGIGPRYCPSIEDKVVRFADRNRHQIFVEPEGLTTPELYPNGISTSLPYDVQHKMVRMVRGFEQAHITRPGYAIEYDYFDPRDLHSSLQTRFVEGLYFAGQINGTTGYEEAAAQGLIAGLNAARQVAGKTPWTPRRDEAYIGVMIDDLTTNGVTEPYRMFTSRAEYRLMLRQDNADLRLTETGRSLGLVDNHRWSEYLQRKGLLEDVEGQFQKVFVRPNTDLSAALEKALQEPISKEQRGIDLLRRPSVDVVALAGQLGISAPENVLKQLETQVRYAGYIDRAQADIERMKAQENVTIPEQIDYTAIPGLSNEVRQKLLDARPETVAGASRVSGVTPAALSILVVHLKRMRASA